MDNNLIRDRGAQFAAVTLASISLFILDLGFNFISTAGIKALMKSIAENNTLTSLTISGNQLDTNASKAVSFALAYNQSLRSLYIDKCSVGYATQRHISAGIVSNSSIKLCVLTGFRLGAVIVTLGFPAEMEHWTNDEVLKFIRLMWKTRNKQSESNNSSNVNEADNKAKPRPVDPATVVALAKSTFLLLGKDVRASLSVKRKHDDLSHECPLVRNDTIIIEKNVAPHSSTCCINLSVTENSGRNFSLENQTKFLLGLTTISSKQCHSSKKPRHMDWLCQHASKLKDLAEEPFNCSELYDYHRYFYSPIQLDPMDRQENTKNVLNVGSFFHSTNQQAELYIGPPSLSSASAPEICVDHNGPSTNYQTQGTPNFQNNLSTALVSMKKKDKTHSIAEFGRRQSYRCLKDAMSSSELNTKTTETSSIFEGGSHIKDKNGSNSSINNASTKLKHNTKTRISYFPQIQEMLELLKLKALNHERLVILRQCKYIEKSLFNGKQVYLNNVESTIKDGFSVSDVEAILLELL